MKTKPKQLDPRAVKLLRLVIEVLKKHGDAYNQNSPGGSIIKGLKRPDCGSPACIAGWMVYFRARFWSSKRKAAYIASLLPSHRSPPEDFGLLYLTPEQWGRLYWPNSWPFEFYGRNIDWFQISPKDAIKRIRHFIKTDGRE